MMESLLERILNTEAQRAEAPSVTDLPAWTNATSSKDLVQEFLIATQEEIARARFAIDSARSYTEIEGRPQFAELLLIPVLHLGPVPIGNNPQVWSQAQDVLVQQLHRLFPRNWRMGYFKEVVPVEDLLGMPCPARRVYLAPPAARVGSVGVQEYPRLHGRLPSIVPQLGFMVVRAKSEKGWPAELLQARWADESVAGLLCRDARLSILDRAARILQFAAWETPIREADLPTILQPRSWSESVGVGVCAWLDLLHAECSIAGYDIALDPRDVDLCSLEIRLAGGGRQSTDSDDPQPVTLRLGVRCHALEPSIWNEIVTTLHRLGGKAATQKAGM